MSDYPPPPGGQPPYNGDVTPPPPGGYGAPPPPGGYGAPPPPLGGAQPPNNNLVLAIITTLFCTPLGIWAIVKAAQVNDKWARGDFAGAQESAKTARNVAIWGLCVAAFVVVVYVIFVVAAIGNAVNNA